MASKLLKLNEAQTINALGLVSTRASGIKSQFGTMGKPFHAGMAASNGIEAAKLSKLGFVSREDGIECDQGFFLTHGWDKKIPTRAIENLGTDFLFPEIKYKYIDFKEGVPNRYYEELVHKFHNPVRVGLYVISFFFYPY